MLEERRVFWDGEEVDMTNKEFEMLKVFAEHPNRAFTRDELLTSVWAKTILEATVRSIISLNGFARRWSNCRSRPSGAWLPNESGWEESSI